jgi:hypothetical protein
LRLGHDPLVLMDAAPPPRIPVPSERPAGAAAPDPPMMRAG